MASTGRIWGEHFIHPRPTYVEGEIVARLKEGLTHLARAENQMEITFENVRECLPRLNIDRDLIEVALTNLLLNAIKYGYRSTTISVFAEDTQDAYLLNVSNYGLGVETEEADRIFEGEYRSPRVIPLKVGSGLGLKIARAAMRKHGGDLRLSSLRNPTIFSMVFPKKLSSATPLRSSRH